MLMHAAAGRREVLYVDMERLLVAANNVRWRLVEGDSVALSLYVLCRWWWLCLKLKLYFFSVESDGKEMDAVQVQEGTVQGEE